MKKIIYLLFIQITVYSQTKIEYFESIDSHERNYVSIFKDNKIPNKEDFLKNAIVLPVYKFEVAEGKLNKNILKGLNYIIFDKRTYFYKNGFSNKFMSNEIYDYLLNKKNLENYIIGVFIDHVYYDGLNFSPLILNNTTESIFDLKNQFNSYNDYLISKHGSIEKYLEIAMLEQSTKKLSKDQIKQSIKNNYKIFEYNCPKDTTLVLKTLINQIKEATITLTTEQEKQLTHRIKSKLNPIEYLHKGQLTEWKKDSTFNNLYNKSKLEQKRCENILTKITGHYDFMIYNVSINNELLEVLSNKQFQDYKNYIDIRFPIINPQVLFFSDRYTYGLEVLLKEKIILKDDVISFENFTNKIIEECGCPIDEYKKPKRLKIN